MSRTHSVLVVDDEARVRDLYADVLAEAGHRVETATDGAAALDRLRHGGAPCVVLSDVRMPRMDGWDLERKLRRLSPRLPVVLVTADRLLSIRGSVRDKPVSADDIAAMVRTSCSHAGRGAATD